MVLIGIDFGNQFSSVAISRNNIKEYLTFDGKATFPSALTFIDNTILLGRIDDVEGVVVADLLKNISAKSPITVRLPHKTKIYHPQELIAIFFEKIKNQCETFFKINIDTALLTVSAALSTVDRNAIIDCALLSNLNIAFSNINEVYIKILGDIPNTVAIHFGTYLTEVLIYSPNQKHNFFIPIGGDTFDKKLMEYLDIEQVEAEKIKKILSINSHSKITRIKFEDICANTFKILSIFFKTLNLKDINPDKIIVTGSTFKIPKNKQLLSEYDNIIFFEEPAIFLNESYNISQIPITLKNTLAVSVAGGISYPVVKKDTELPAMNILTFTTYNDNQTEILLDIICGSRIFTRDNQILAKFLINNIPKSTRGNERIELTFNIDMNHMLKITSKIVSTGKIDYITVSIPEKEDKINENKSDINELILLETHQKLESIIGILRHRIGNDDERLIEIEKTILNSNLEQLKDKINECVEIWNLS